MSGEHALFPELFGVQAVGAADKAAIIWRGRSISYAALHRRAQAFAAALEALLPDAPHTVVAVAMKRQPDLVAAILGVMLSGRAYLPLDGEQPAERLQRITRAGGCAAVICDNAAAEIDLGLPILRSEQVARPQTPFAPGRLSADGLAYVIATSGSTGAPKPVAIRHGALACFIAWGRSAFPAEALANVAFTTPVTFDVSVFEMLVPLAAGGTLHLYEDLSDLWSDGAARPSLTSGVPSLMASFLPRPETPFVNVAGEALPAALGDQLSTVPGRIVRNLYGPTECTVYATMAEVKPGEPITIGKPLDHVRTYVLDEALRPVTDGRAGELYLAGPTLAEGYLGMPGQTARSFVPDPYGGPGSRMYRTGDLARIDDDGNIHYLGRRDGQVKVRGLRIELGEIEAALHAAGLGMNEAAALVITGAGGRPRIVACLTRDVDIAAACEARLPAAFRPQVVVKIAALPLTSSGKLDRRALAAQVEAMV